MCAEHRPGSTANGDSSVPPPGRWPAVSSDRRQRHASSLGNHSAHQASDGFRAAMLAASPADAGTVSGAQKKRWCWFKSVAGIAGSRMAATLSRSFLTRPHARARQRPPRGRSLRAFTSRGPDIAPMPLGTFRENVQTTLKGEPAVSRRACDRRRVAATSNRRARWLLLGDFALDCLVSCVLDCSPSVRPDGARARRGPQ